MVSLTALWLPILLSAVIVFVASSIMHMLLRYHQSDYKKLPDEESVRTTLRASNLQPGVYVIPHCKPNEMNSPAAIEKYNQGPVGILTMMRSGRPAMPKFLAMWFGYCLIIGILVAHLAGQTYGPGAPFRAVFHVAAIAAFLAYGIGNLSNGIWKAQPWSTVAKEVVDGLVYGALTGATFAWLWPK